MGLYRDICTLDDSITEQTHLYNIFREIDSIEQLEKDFEILRNYKKTDHKNSFEFISSIIGKRIIDYLKTGKEAEYQKEMDNLINHESLVVDPNCDSPACFLEKSIFSDLDFDLDETETVGEIKECIFS